MRGSIGVPVFVSCSLLVVVGVVGVGSVRWRACMWTVCVSVAHGAGCVLPVIRDLCLFCTQRPHKGVWTWNESVRFSVVGDAFLVLGWWVLPGLRGDQRVWAHSPHTALGRQGLPSRAGQTGRAGPLHTLTLPRAPQVPRLTCPVSDVSRVSGGQRRQCPFSEHGQEQPAGQGRAQLPDRHRAWLPGAPRWPPGTLGLGRRLLQPGPAG